MTKSKIEWTDSTWNCVTGCTKVSAGCTNCYAERHAKRFWGERRFSNVRRHYDRLDRPLHWRKPRRVFVNSRSDLFHPEVPLEFIAAVFGVMAATPQHSYQILTKRPERMLDIFEALNITRECDENAYCRHHASDLTGVGLMPDNSERTVWPLPNVMLGVSVEDQDTAEERIPLLLQAPAALRFISAEPLLGPVEFGRSPAWDPSGIYFDGLDLVIVGCESGPKARPMHSDWVHSIRDQCVEAGIPFFLKQMRVDGKLVKMPEIDGRVWNQMPEEVGR